jgi:hypothetical protein
LLGFPLKVSDSRSYTLSPAHPERLRFVLAHPFSCRGPDSDDSEKEGSSVVFPLNDIDHAWQDETRPIPPFPFEPRKFHLQLG